VRSERDFEMLFECICRSSKGVMGRFINCAVGIVT
jgi:hypothetical protein